MDRQRDEVIRLARELVETFEDGASKEHEYFTDEGPFSVSADDLLPDSLSERCREIRLVLVQLDLAEQRAKETAQCA